MDVMKTVLFVSIALFVMVMTLGGVNYLENEISHKLAIESMKEKLNEYILDI